MGAATDRQKRLVALTRHLSAHPHENQSVSYLSRVLGVAKSTISEDLAVVRDAMTTYGLGRVVTQVGPQGGVAFVPTASREMVQAGLDGWCTALAATDRMTSEGFLYVTDLLFRPRLIEPMGMLLADRFRDAAIDVVATVETRGIPLALETARHLAIDTVLLRRDNRLSEGSSLSINYLSGSSRRVQSMSLARRTPIQGKRVLFVDDFMQAGGTARAASDLLGEFSARVVGVGVLVATSEPSRKLVHDFASCLTWHRDRRVVEPSEWIQQWMTDGIR
ncbi:MAG: phosphoribosyltransferase family protein [Thermaerobacter sp.]|nr:phosphoribosyltransferase family protein [Thermaerobacter sp.]